MNYEQHRGTFEMAYDESNVLPPVPAKRLRKGDGYDSDSIQAAWNVYKFMLADVAKQAAPVVRGSWDHLKLMMEHSAFDGVLQLGDALANIADFAATPQAAPVAQLSKPPEGWQPIQTAPQFGLVDIYCNGRRYADCHFDRICSEFRHITACNMLIRLKGASHWMESAAAPTTAKDAS